MEYNNPTIIGFIKKWLAEWRLADAETVLSFALEDDAEKEFSSIFARGYIRGALQALMLLWEDLNDSHGKCVEAINKALRQEIITEKCETNED